MRVKHYFVKWRLRHIMSHMNYLMCQVFSVESVKKWNTKVLYKRKLDLNNPVKLNEKIIWLEFNTDEAKRALLTDKYEVRRYIAKKGYGDCLVPVLGLFNHPDEIDPKTLPDSFVLKATHGCDMNIICSNKRELDWNDARKKMNLWMRTNLAYMSLELHYRGIQPRILCEAFLDHTGDLIDYKFHCSDGIPRFVLVCSDRNDHNYRDVFDMKWNHLHVVCGTEENPVEPTRPEHFQQMKEMAKILSQDVPFVRVDLYEHNGKIYFGELTFTPATGVLFHFQEDFLLEQGRYCSLPLKENECTRNREVNL